MMSQKIKSFLFLIAFTLSAVLYHQQTAIAESMEEKLVKEVSNGQSTQDAPQISSNFQRRRS